MAMTAPLLILMVGAAASWVSIEYFTGAFSAFGFHGVHALTVAEFVEETFSSPAFLLSLAALGLGLVLWFFRKQIIGISLLNKPVAFIKRGYGFNTIYDGLMLGVREVAVRFRKTHTGDLNVNLTGVALALLLMLAALFFFGGA
jgi:hypothetical protein